MTTPASVLTRAYLVQSITASTDKRMHVALVEDNSTADANGAPMGTSQVTFTMSVAEARQFFPGDRITVSLTKSA